MNNCNSMILKKIDPIVTTKKWASFGTTFRVDYTLETSCHKPMESQHDQSFNTIKLATKFKNLLTNYIGLEFDYSDWKQCYLETITI